MICLIKDIKDIWFRNSLAFSYWQFGKSDIDITVAVSSLSFNSGQKISRLHAFLKFFLVVIGELVIVDTTPSGLDMLLNCINSYELRRDPTLCKLITLSPLTEPERIIFLHRFIVSNWKHSQKNSIRADKLSYVAELLNIKSNLITFDLLKSTLGLWIGDSFNENIDHLYSQIDSGIFSTSEVSPAFYSLFFNKLYHENYKLNQTINIQNKELIFQTIRWEIWASCSNRYFGNIYDFKKHISGMLSRVGLIKLESDQYLRLLELSTALDLISSKESIIDT
jgi:hypothetical protein